jgi:hypothetical protein
VYLGLDAHLEASYLPAWKPLEPSGSGGFHFFAARARTAHRVTHAQEYLSGSSLHDPVNHRRRESAARSSPWPRTPDLAAGGLTAGGGRSIVSARAAPPGR